jgi:hypothetical protein
MAALSSVNIAPVIGKKFPIFVLKDFASLKVYVASKNPALLLSSL